MAADKLVLSTITLLPSTLTSSPCQLMTVITQYRSKHFYSDRC